MDAVIENMRNTFGNGVRKMFSNNNQGGKNNAVQREKVLSDTQTVRMSLCEICEQEESTVPFLVRDISKFISQKSMKVEGIFRVSAPLRQVAELRELYESNLIFHDDLLTRQNDTTEVTGHAAAGLLKQFLRQLPEPLIPDDVLRIFLDSKSLSDADFCEKVWISMDDWPPPHRCTLIFLLTFLHTVAQESENRMSVNGLAVVFGPNVFKLPDGIEGLQAQTIANQTFERLLSCSSLLSERLQTTKKQPVCCPLFPTPQERLSLRKNEQNSKLPTKPVPPVRQSLSQPSDSNNIVSMATSTDNAAAAYISAEQHNNELVGDTLESKISRTASTQAKSEGIPDGDAMAQPTNFKVSLTEDQSQKSSSLEDIPEVLDQSDSPKESQTDSGSYTCELEPNKKQSDLDNCIRDVVKTRLFNSESSSVSDEAEVLRMNGLLSSTTAGRNRGPKNRRLPSRLKHLLNKVELQDSGDDDVTTVTIATGGSNTTMDTRENPSAPTITSSVATVTTPDSGCVLEDRDYPHNSSPIKEELHRLGRRSSPVLIPKLNLRDSFDEDEMIGHPTAPPCVDIVPQLDLSSMLESVDREVIKPVYPEITKVPREMASPQPAPRHHSDVARVMTLSQPAPRHHSASKQTKKKKKKSPAKKTVKLSEVTPQQSDCEVIDDNCGGTMEQSKDRIIQVLRDNRRIAGRPYDVTKMVPEELQEEKLSMQRELLKFEARYGRPTSKESKQLMREIYDRYRTVKRMLGANGKREIDENDNSLRQEMNDSFLVSRPFPPESCGESVDGALDTPTSDLLQRLQELRARRKQLRRILKDFENKRKIENPSLERRVMRDEYEEYRQIKSNVRELEIALAKKGVEIF